jgi:hypothetical protein
MHVALVARCDSILQNTKLSNRVKSARLNFTRKEIAALKQEVDAFTAKHGEKKALDIDAKV